MMKVQVGYTSIEAEIYLTQAITNSRIGINTQPLSKALSDAEVIALQDAAARVLVCDKIVEYAVSLVRASSEWRGIAHGAGVRASIDLI